ncbi:MAG: WXG100 family type VII secretion target [Pseudonocardiales bacterium]
MADYSADLNDMAKAANDVRQVNSQVQGQLTRLMTELDGQASAWKGGAAVAFQRLRQRWHADATKLNEALAHIADAIDASKTTYHTLDQNSEQTMNSIASVLG